MFIDGFVFIGAKVMKIILKAYVIVEFMLLLVVSSVFAESGIISSANQNEILES
jgi:hypothetical protein